jgi:hypothetical protein
MKGSIWKFGLFKVSIAISGLVIIVLFGWYLFLKKDYHNALLDYQKSKSDLVKSFSEIKQIRRLLIAKNEMEKGGELLLPELFFQKQLSKAGIDFKSYHVKPPRDRNHKIQSGKKRKSVIDREVEINFKVKSGKKRLFIPRPNWFVALFNCEAGSKRWRLRQFSIRAKEEFKSQAKKGGYPSELSDDWYIDKLVFVSREPKK